MAAKSSLNLPRQGLRLEQSSEAPATLAAGVLASAKGLFASWERAHMPKRKLSLKGLR